MLLIEPATDAAVLTRLNEEVQNLHYRLYPNYFKPFDYTAMHTAITHMLQQENCEALVATWNGIPVGYVIIFLQQQAETAFKPAMRSVHLDQIGVTSAYRKKGVATALIAAVVQRAQEWQALYVDLYHWTENTEARRFFESKGFHSSNERRVLRLV